MKLKIKFKIIKIFEFLNNIRLIIASRKYINKIIKNEVENNELLRKSKSYFLNDITRFQYINEKNVKMYISQFIVKKGHWKLSENQYYLTLDFLFFIKKYLNDAVHFVKKSEGITSNKEFSRLLQLNIYNEIKINDKNSVILQENKEKKEIDNKKKLNKSKFFFDKTFKQKKRNKT